MHNLTKDNTYWEEVLITAMAKNTSTPSSDYTDNNFGINVQIGRLIKNNTVLGVIVSYSSSNSHVTGYPDSNYNKGNSISAGVFYRKYKRLIKME